MSLQSKNDSTTREPLTSHRSDPEFNPPSELVFLSTETVIAIDQNYEQKEADEDSGKPQKEKWWKPRRRLRNRDSETQDAEISSQHASNHDSTSEPKEWKHQILARNAHLVVKAGVKRTTKSIKGLAKEFGSFMGDGRILQYAIGMVIGTAFTAVIGSLVTDLISPFIGMAIGTQLESFFVVLRSPDPAVCKRNATSCVFFTVADAHNAGAVTWNLGSFLQNVLNFFIVAFAVFAMIRFFKTFLVTTKQQLKNIKTGLKQKSTSFKGSLFQPRTANGISPPSPLPIKKTERFSEALSPLAPYSVEGLRRSASDSGLSRFGSKPTTASTENTVTINFSGDGVSAQSSPQAPLKHKNLAEYFGKDPHQSFNDLKECPYCLSHIPARASRCAHCTSTVEVVERECEVVNDTARESKGKNVKFDMNFNNIPYKI
ncbi:hypothetical protein HDU98_009574 [Podochytrium sp. JEL0797]|nr:hypothetical protein HDU98_009574 [Podochytrium sp. JEL0797]